MDRWVGKTALVTGASSGIGEAISKALVVSGLNVLGIARRENRLKKLSASLKGVKGSFHYLCGDVCNENVILKAFEYIEKEFGGVDVLVNNAGILRSESIADGKTASFRAVLDVNVLAPTICTREALKLMRKQKTEGYIFNINSIAGLNATITKLPINLYPASKFALRAMTETTKTEIAENKDEIRITGIHPGMVLTDIATPSGLDPAIFTDNPHLDSEHIADVVVFALSMPLVVQLDEVTITPLGQKLP